MEIDFPSLGYSHYEAGIGACRISDRGGGHCKGVGLVGGPGAELLGRRRTFQNLQKKSSQNGKKIIMLAYFQNSLKTWVKFSRVWTKNTKGRKIMRNFRKFLRNFSKKRR